MQMTIRSGHAPGFLAGFRALQGLCDALGKASRLRRRRRPAQTGSKAQAPSQAGSLHHLTLLILLILWPVGMVMLWRKKVRMQAGTKLLISLLTLCMSVFLIVFALTVHVDNPKYTEFQDKANDWLNKAAADVAVAGDAAYKKGVETWGVVTEFADNAAQPVLNTVADGLDKGVELADEHPREAGAGGRRWPRGGGNLVSPKVRRSPPRMRRRGPSRSACPRTPPDPDSASPWPAAVHRVGRVPARPDPRAHPSRAHPDAGAHRGALEWSAVRGRRARRRRPWPAELAPGRPRPPRAHRRPHPGVPTPTHQHAARDPGEGRGRRHGLLQ